MPSLHTRAAADIVAAVAKITIAAANAATVTSIVNAANMTNIITMKANVTAMVITTNTRNR